MKIKKVVQKATATDPSAPLLDDSTQVSTSPSLLSQPESWESHVSTGDYNQESSLPEEVSTPSNTSRSLGMLFTSQKTVLIQILFSQHQLLIT